MNKPVVISLTTWLLIHTGYLPGFAARVPHNLIRNPGFETLSDKLPDGWIQRGSGDKQDFNIASDQTEKHTGKSSLKISEICSPGSVPGISMANPVSIHPKAKYILNFWYKTMDISEYPMALMVRFNVRSAKTQPLRYQKRISTSAQWKQCFIMLENLPEDAFTVGIEFCTDVRTRGSIWIDDVVFSEAGKPDVRKFEKWRRQPVPGIRSSFGNKKLLPAGFFRIEKLEDRWWLIEPEGNPYWAIAIAGALPARNPENPVVQSATFENIYGRTAGSYANKIYEIFTQGCGFNALAGWSSEKISAISVKRFESGLSYMPLTQVLGLSAFEGDHDIYVKDREGKSLNKPGHPMVDPFNPEWRRLAREKAERIIPVNRGKPWFLGWYIDNEIDFKNLYRYVWADYSSKEFLKSLITKYKNIEELNHAWTSLFGEYNYTSFDDLLNAKPEPRHWSDPLWKDFTAFERKMLEEYIIYTCDLVRELDPDHLVISNRIHLSPMPDLYRSIDLWGKYDIVCMNIYPENNKIGFDEGELEIMKKLHEGTGRPVMIGEWSVPAVDSKLYETAKDSLGRPLDWSWPQVLRNQKERGEAYETCMKQLVSLNFVIGAGWFITMDVDTNVRRANRGIMNSRFEIYRDLTNKMKKTHNEIIKVLHLRN